MDARRWHLPSHSPTNRSPRKSAVAQAMTPENPHFLLFSEASQDQCATPSWRFVLQDVESHRRFSATDNEPSETGQERLELLAVVRGLEALDRSARVTLVTKSRYVSRGIKRGLAEWRSNDWRWERFGRVVPVRDDDLWRRVDRALRFHEVDCQAWHFGEPAEESRLEDQSPTFRSDSAQPRPCKPVGRVKLRNGRRQPAAGGSPAGWLTGVGAALTSRARRAWAASLTDSWSPPARPRRQTVGATG